MPKNENTAKNLIGVAEAAKLTGLDRRTLHRKVERGELPYVTKLDGLRGAYIFNRSDVLALLSPTTPVDSASPHAESAGVSSLPSARGTA